MRELKQCVGGEKKNVEGGLSTLHYTLTLLQDSRLELKITLIMRAI